MSHSGGKKTAIVFAVYAANEHGLNVFLKIMNQIEQLFSDARIFVGINPCQMQSVLIRYLNNSRLNLTYDITPAELVLDSDASAFQTALRMLLKSQASYGLIWFIHTKSSTNFSHEPTLDWLLHNLVRNRLRVEESFLNPSVGACGVDIVIHPEPIQDVISQYKNYPFSQLQLMYLFTFYVIRGGIVHDFIETCSNSFFSQKINSDRYFFERDFYQIAFMSGHIPAFMHAPQLHFNDWDKVVCNRDTVFKTMNDWIMENHSRVQTAAPLHTSMMGQKEKTSDLEQARTKPS